MQFDKWRLQWIIVGAALAIGSPAESHEAHVSDIRAFSAIMVRLSADGESLAFSYQGAIWRMPRQGGPMKRLTDGPEFDIEPTWSPDGSKIAFQRSRQFYGGRLALIDAQSGEPISIPNDVQTYGNIAFDQSGTRVFGLFQPLGKRPRLAWCTLESGDLTDAVEEANWPVIPIGTTGYQWPRYALSPDDEFVAIATTADLPDEQTGNQGPQNDIWLVSLTGQPPRRLTTWPARIHEICWRADRQALILATDRGGVHNDLWELPLQDLEKGPRKLTFGQADENSPDTARTGRWLSYTDNRHGATMIVVRDLQNEHESITAPQLLEFGSSVSGTVKPSTGKVMIRVDDGATGPTTARVVLRHENGKFHAPPGALYRLNGSDLHFYLHESTTIELPAGTYSLKAGRGPEHRVREQSFEVHSETTTEVQVTLERWTDQRAEGWVSGENHIHANYGYGHWYNSPASMRLQCNGEDLVVANFMVANSDGDGVFDREFFLGRPDPLSNDLSILYWNEEFRSTIWGHMTLLNLKNLVTPIFTGFKSTSHPHDVPTNADIADHVHEQDGIVNYTHPAHNLQDPYASAYSAKAMPIDVALGKVDSMDVMGANQYANMAIWYRLLNCGLRIPASAGTDCFLNRIVSRLPGSDRVYVHCGSSAGYQEWIDKLKQGRTFVTNGPMIRFTVNGEEAGATLSIDNSREITVHCQVRSQFPLERIELMINGKSQLLRAAAVEDGLLDFVEELNVQLTHSSWIALRVKGQRGPHQAASESFAHTSPVYVTIGNMAIQSAEDADFFVKWIERLREDVRKRNQIPSGRWEPVESQLARALEFYRRQIDTPPP